MHTSIRWANLEHPSSVGIFRHKGHSGRSIFTTQRTAADILHEEAGSICEQSTHFRLSGVQMTTVLDVQATDGLSVVTILVFRKGQLVGADKLSLSKEDLGHSSKPLEQVVKTKKCLLL